MRIIFTGTSEFGAIILDKLTDAGYVPLAVITETDKPVGRKKILTPPPVKITAQNHKITVLQPKMIKNLQVEIRNLNPDLLITAAYGQILPKEILDIPKYGCLNAHPSLLPKYRGPSPIQSAILNGDSETGVTIMLMDERVDHGPILAQKQTAIGPYETAKQLHDRLAVLGAKILADAIPDWTNGDIKSVPQDEKNATYTKILKRDDGLIDWKKSPREIDRQIRALNPWPGTYTVHKGKRIKILKVRLVDDELMIEEVQPEGKKPMAFEDFLRGNPDFSAHK